MEYTTRSITDVSIRMPTVNQIAEVLFFQSGFNTSLVLMGAILLGIACGLIGCFTLLRKRALMSDALAHSALPGLAIAFLLAPLFGVEGKNLLVLLVGATCSGVLGVLCVHGLTRHTRLTEDAAVGAILSVFFGAGIVLMSAIQSMQSSGAGGLNHFIFGQTAAMSSLDAYVLLITAAAALVAIYLLQKEFSLVCFDPEFATVQGWPVARIDLLMMALLTVITVIGLQSVGMLLIVALLIIPPAAARFWTERLNTMIVLSALFGGLSGYLGASASALLPRLPAGAVIVLSAGVVFLFSFFVAPERGLLSRTLSLLRLRIRIAKDHLLRALYEEYERQNLELSSAVPIKSLGVLVGSTPLTQRLSLRLSHWAGLLSVNRSEVRFTESGLAQAKSLVHSHRLWEQYLLHFAELPVSHVDYSADKVEHILSEEILSKLEARLANVDSGAPSEYPPHSPHPLAAREIDAASGEVKK